MKLLRYSLLITFSYVALALSYILVSTQIVSELARSVEHAARLEAIKGSLFVVFTSALVWAVSYSVLRRMDRDARELMRRRTALVGNERRVYSGLMAASIAHDANNVLTGVLVDLEDLQHGTSEDPAVVAARVQQSVARLIEMNSRLLSAGRHRISSDLRDVELADVVREVLDGLRSHVRVRFCQVRVEHGGPTTLRAFPVLLHQLTANLVLNAAEATEGKGQVLVRVGRQGRQVLLEVHDNGPGVPVERRAGLFEALVTTKAEGSGLGLFSVKACVESHGGQVEVGESPLGGACFRVVLPEEPPGESGGAGAALR